MMRTAGLIRMVQQSATVVAAARNHVRGLRARVVDRTPSSCRQTGCWRRGQHERRPLGIVGCVEVGQGGSGRCSCMGVGVSVGVVALRQAVMGHISGVVSGVILIGSCVGAEVAVLCSCAGIRIVS